MFYQLLLIREGGLDHGEGLVLTIPGKSLQITRAFCTSPVASRMKSILTRVQPKIPEFQTATGTYS